MIDMEGRESKEVTLDPELYTKTGKPRKRRKKKSRDYFTQETEDAIVQYLKTDDFIEKNRLFSRYINDSLYKLAENIVHTFKFYHTDTEGIEDLKHQVVVFLLEKFHRYDQSQGKAYSFFGTIAKRYLILNNSTNYKKMKLKTDLVEEEVDNDKGVYNQIIREGADKELSDIIDSYIQYMDYNLEELFPAVEDQAIVIAALEVLKRRESLDVLNKQQFYFCMKEITGQQTPAITKVLRQMKYHYKKVLDILHVDGELETDDSDIY